MLPCFELLVPSQLDADIIVHESTNFYLAVHEGQIQTVQYSEWKQSPTEWILLPSGYIAWKANPRMLLHTGVNDVLELREDKATVFPTVTWHGSSLPNQSVISTGNDLWYVPKKMFFPNYPGWKMTLTEQSYLGEHPFYMWCPSEIDLHGSFVTKLTDFTLIQQKGINVTITMNNGRVVQFQPIFTEGVEVKQANVINLQQQGTWINKLYLGEKAYRATLVLVDPSIADTWSYDPINQKVFTVVQSKVYFYGDRWQIGELGELLGSGGVTLPSAAWHNITPNLYINMPSIISRSAWYYLTKTSVFDLLHESEVDIYKYNEPLKFDAATLTWKSAWTPTEAFTFLKRGSGSFVLTYQGQELNSSLNYSYATVIELKPQWYLDGLFDFPVILVIRTVNDHTKAQVKTTDLRPSMRLSLVYRQKDMSKQTFLAIYMMFAIVIILIILFYKKVKR